VVTTVTEHNSVLRPLRALEDQGRITVTRVKCDRAGLVDPSDVHAALSDRTRLVALNHASNVTGALQDAATIGQIARNAGALFLLDAAQSLGETPIDAAAWNVDLLAAPGHKGLMGPLGTGVLFIRDGVERQLNPFKLGGTGSHSERDTQPDELPDKFESGNLNVAGIVGLLAGAEHVAQQGVAAIREHVSQLSRQLLDAIRRIPGVRVFAPENCRDRVGLVSLQMDGYDPQELAAVLDAGYRIQSRAGLHCAPLIHAAIGTLAGGGTLRLSPGAFTTHDQIEVAIRAIS
jgi:selenocysteine lyase/cysteine desulfurase